MMITNFNWFWVILTLGGIIAALAILPFLSVILSTTRTVHNAAMLRLIAGTAEANDGQAATVRHPAAKQLAASQPFRVAGVFAQEQQAIRLPNHKTLIVTGAARNTTIVFPLAMDMFSSFFWHEHLARDKEVKNE